MPPRIQNHEEIEDEKTEEDEDDDINFFDFKDDLE